MYDFLSMVFLIDDFWGFFLKRFGCFFLVELIRLLLGMFVCVMLIVVLLFVGGGVGGLVGVVVNVEMYE